MRMVRFFPCFSADLGAFGGCVWYVSFLFGLVSLPFPALIVCLLCVCVGLVCSFPAFGLFGCLLFFCWVWLYDPFLGQKEF